VKPLERAVVNAALTRYRAWAIEFPTLNKAIVAGSNEGSGGKRAADLIRACSALLKSRRKGK
jgi:hypothetical protein